MGCKTPVLLNNAVLLIGALAVGCVIIAGSIDISIGSLLGLSAVLAGLADRAGLSPVYTASIALAAGATGGWLNGWIATRSRVHAIVVTLGTMAIYRGLIIEWSGGRWILGLSDGLRALAHSTPVGIPMLLWLALSTWLAMWVLLRYSRLGRRMYAVGSAPRAARYVGITERAVLPWAFALCGMLIGLAGLLQAARFGQVQTNMGTALSFRLLPLLLLVACTLPADAAARGDSPRRVANRSTGERAGLTARARLLGRPLSWGRHLVHPRLGKREERR